MKLSRFLVIAILLWANSAMADLSFKSAAGVFAQNIFAGGEFTLVTGEWQGCENESTAGYVFLRCKTVEGKFTLIQQASGLSREINIDEIRYFYETAKSEPTVEYVMFGKMTRTIAGYQWEERVSIHLWLGHGSREISGNFTVRDTKESMALRGHIE